MQIRHHMQLTSNRFLDWGLQPQYVYSIICKSTFIVVVLLLLTPNFLFVMARKLFNAPESNILKNCGFYIKMGDTRTEGAAVECQTGGWLGALDVWSGKALHCTMHDAICLKPWMLHKHVR